MEKVETKNGANTLMKFEYAPYDDASVASATENLGGQTSSTAEYDYDTRAQLKEEVRQGAGASYRAYLYDRAGNLEQLDFTPEGQQRTSWSNSYNQLQSVTGALSYGLTYGEDGAVAGLDDGTNVWTYLYDDENRLQEVRRGGQVVYTCVYGALGRPAIETVNGVTRYLVWVGDELLLEVGTNGSVAVRHVWGAGGYQGYFRNEGSTPTRLALRDGLGHVRGLMNMSKVITDRYVFDAYGNDVAPGLHNTTEGNSLRFRWNGSYGYRTLYLLAGQQTTNTATLMHVGARHYSPALRRWLQRDPIDLASGKPNLYVYAFGDPVNAVDPSGMVIYLLPGTFQRGKAGVFSGALITEISRALHRTGDLCHVFQWGREDKSDWPFESNWRAAAEDLASSLARYYKTQARAGEPIWIVGYSHGGTVALLASQILAEQGIPVEGIVMLGTPLVYADEKGHSIAPGATTKGVWLVYEYMDIAEGVAWTFSPKDLGPVAKAWGSGGFEGTLRVVLFGHNTRGTSRFQTHGCYLSTDVWKKHITPRMKVGR